MRNAGVAYARECGICLVDCIKHSGIVDTVELAGIVAGKALNVHVDAAYCAACGCIAAEIGNSQFIFTLCPHRHAEHAIH